MRFTCNLVGKWSGKYIATCLIDISFQTRVHIYVHTRLHEYINGMACALEGGKIKLLFIIIIREAACAVSTLTN